MHGSHLSVVLLLPCICHIPCVTMYHFCMGLVSASRPVTHFDCFISVTLWTFSGFWFLAVSQSAKWFSVCDWEDYECHIICQGCRIMCHKCHMMWHRCHLTKLCLVSGSRLNSALPACERGITNICQCHCNSI